MTSPLILWFRQDLRLLDNPALVAAEQEVRPIIPLYIFDNEDPWKPGGASSWWLHRSLEAFEGQLEAFGLKLILRSGSPETILEELSRSTGARLVYWNRLYEPYARARDEKIKTHLKSQGFEVKSFNSALLIEPWHHLKSNGTPYQIFTPFWKALLSKGPPAKPLAQPETLKSYAKHLPSESLPPIPHWSGKLNEFWSPGEEYALTRLSEFLEKDLSSYSEDRNRPDKDSTSRLSAHLHWGEISPRTIWYQTLSQMLGCEAEGFAFLRELAWREFSYHLLYFHPKLSEEPLKKMFENFPWVNNPSALEAWQKGITGYPFVDAGLRELWHTGGMHNRVRMVVASFLIKDLLIHWRDGERWFWDTLVDADLANNAASWQWVAGSGADASPYFRVFNPALQGEKFDPEGTYVKRWVPELQNLTPTWIHKPFAAPSSVLSQAGIILGKNYPYPLVDHNKARERALAAYKVISKATSS
ncbi:Deoxyribodipyrimidine photo-lyase [Candidatus Bealeia paramacronuclearis]|uniref:Deoxyribodipyrimidine photo-lyase n=1 Tax=Candidatus Bealeia paramacronuclearis TaxID=1921001 RepID=A0ABZ2C2P4_9PROT|nr:Deoxyribodipyrimidine photo-lyase [Candidatus Bealeia paramacronuclearis]